MWRSSRRANFAYATADWKLKMIIHDNTMEEHGMVGIEYSQPDFGLKFRCPLDENIYGIFLT